jgi:hypothetical protein
MFNMPSLLSIDSCCSAIYSRNSGTRHFWRMLSHFIIWIISRNLFPIRILFCFENKKTILYQTWIIKSVRNQWKFVLGKKIPLMREWSEMHHCHILSNKAYEICIKKCEVVLQLHKPSFFCLHRFHHKSKWLSSQCDISNGQSMHHLPQRFGYL